MSKTYSLKTVQHIPISSDEAWDFFSSPENLRTITPSHLQMDIISKYKSEKIYAGQLIEYKLRPLLNIPMHWVTEITHVEEKKYFVDEQRFGPFGLWHHQHHFCAIEGGVEMTDIVHYKLPLGFLGNIAHALFVRKQVKHIFDYRFKKVATLFEKSWDH